MPDKHFPRDSGIERNIKMEIKNTLVLGNGFSRSIFKEMPSWERLFKEVDSVIKNYTILYEVSLLKGKERTDNETKRELIREIEESHSLKKIDENVLDLKKIGEYLARNNVYNIITTNYDKGLELILCDICGYEETEPKGLVKEEIYSIRTYKEYINKKNNHQLKLWKIHGDIDRIKSITFGFDQYCGSLSKLSEYIKGNYKSAKGPTCRVPMKQKCETQQFDNLSWAELFFNTNVYIVGLGLDFSEIDIWWLLNKHIRIKREVPEVRNNIYYIFNNQYDDKDEKKDIFEALEAFQVECQGIDSNENYIKNIFNVMRSTAFIN